jgi:hypothetical protein
MVLAAWRAAKLVARAARGSHVGDTDQPAMEGRDCVAENRRDDTTILKTITRRRSNGHEPVGHMDKWLEIIAGITVFGPSRGRQGNCRATKCLTFIFCFGIQRILSGGP